MEGDQHEEHVEGVFVQVSDLLRGLEADEAGEGAGFKTVGVHREETESDLRHERKENGEDAERTERVVAEGGLVVLAEKPGDVAENGARAFQEVREAGG